MLKKIILCALSAFSLYSSQDKKRKHEPEESLSKAHKKARKNVYSSLHEAIQAGDVGAFEELLPKMQDRKDEIQSITWSDGNSYNITPLMLSAMNGHAAIAELLLKAGADVNKQNHYGMTALLFAAWQGHTALGELLLKAGADMNKQNNQGDTALMYAAEKDHAAIADLLIK